MRSVPTLAAVVVALALGTAQGGPTCRTTAPRTDCGYSGINQQQCESRGCCWDPVTAPTDGTPWCFNRSEAITGYEVTNAVKTGNGMVLDLGLLQGGLPAFGADIKHLRVNVTYGGATGLRVAIYDPARDRWQVPQSLIPRDQDVERPPRHARGSVADADYAFSYTSKPFGFAVVRSSTGEVLFNSTPPADASFNGLVFKDQYLEMSTALPADAFLYGVGESTQPTGLALNASHGKPYTMWTHDTPSSATDTNLYGAWPFYVDLRPGSGNAHGVFLLNSNGMDVTYSGSALTYGVIGGILDLYFHTGPTPEEVASQQTTLVGRPAMPPYWSLGYHNCRWGYSDIDEVADVVANYSSAGIPLEAAWMDIDYMRGYRDWTFDPDNFPAAKVKALADKLHSNGQRMVVIVDPAIKQEQGYAPYEDGVKQGIFLKDAKGDVFIGKVWPGLTAFPDFISPEGQSYWEQQIRAFLAQVPLDGLWIDMNEASNFCTGACDSNSDKAAESSALRSLSASQYARYGPDFDPNKPPYAIDNDGNRDPLDSRAIAADAVHCDGTLEYDAHNLYGFSEAVATHNALASVRGKRPFVLSRSTFPGSGRFTAHWTGDNAATWPNLYWSLLGAMNANLQGIPFVGSDICGFQGDTNEELCTRWIQVGAFTPFSRDHNTKGAKSQELYRWEGVASAARDVLAMRYSLLPYYYTLFAAAHMDSGKGEAAALAAAAGGVAAAGGTVARPLWFRCPSDPVCATVDRQLLIGDALLLSPVLEQGATSVRAYFPRGDWYSAFTKEAVAGGPGPRWQTLPAPMDTVHLHMAGGRVIPMLGAAPTTAASRATNFTLTVTVDSTALAATGALFWDDGESVGAAEAGAEVNTIVAFRAAFNSASAAAGKLASTVHAAGCTDMSLADTVEVVGASAAPATGVTLGGKALPASSWSFDADKGVLTVTGLAIDLNKPFALSWQ